MTQTIIKPVMINCKSLVRFTCVTNNKGNRYEVMHSNAAQLIELKKGRKDIADESIIKRTIQIKGLISGFILGILKDPFFFIYFNTVNNINQKSQKKPILIMGNPSIIKNGTNSLITMRSKKYHKNAL